MKRFVILCIIFATVGLFGQTTPNLNLYLPPHNSPNWDIPINLNFSLLDKFLSGVTPLPALALTGWEQAGVVNVSALTTTYSTAPLGAEINVGDGQDPYDCTVGGGSAIFLHKCYCGIVVSGSCTTWLPRVPKPTTTQGGVVEAKNCGSSAIQSINTDTTATCSASSTGGNGVIYQQAATSPLVGDGTYKTIYTYTLPGGTLGSSGGLRITCDFTTATGAASPNSQI